MIKKIQFSGHFGDVISLFSGTFIFAVSSVLNNIVLGRNLEKIDFGRFNAVNSTVSLLSLFVLFGLNITSVRVISKFRKNNPYYISSAINRLKFFYKILLGIISLIYAIIIPLLSKYIFHDYNLILLFYLSLIYLFSLSYSELLSGFLTGLGEFNKLRNINYIKALLTISTMAVTFITKNILFIYLIFVVVNLVYIYFGNKWLKTVLNEHFNYSQITLPSKFNNKIFAYSGYIFLGGVVVLPFTYSSNLILSSIDGIHVFAVLSIFSTWQGVLTFFPVTYSKIVLPYISGNKIKQSKIEKFTIATRLNNFSVYFIYLFLMLSSTFILSLYGKSYTSYLSVFNLYLGATAIAFMGNTYGAQVQVRGFKFTILIGNFIVGLSMLLFTLFLHRQLGILALCIGMLMGNFFNFLVSFFTIMIKDNFPLKLHISVICSFFIMFISILTNYFWRDYFLPVSFLFLFLFYFVDRGLRLYIK